MEDSRSKRYAESVLGFVRLVDERPRDVVELLHDSGTCFT